MMDLVDVLVKWSPVHGPMCPVVPSIFHHEEDSDLVGHGEKRRERDACGKAKVLSHGVKKPYLWEFDGEVAQEY